MVSQHDGQATESSDRHLLVQVEPEHLLLGMMTVSSSSGFFGCKVSLDAARREVQAALGPGKIRQPASPHRKDPEFSPYSKKLFENACTESKRTGMSTITVEHIVIALYCICRLGYSPDSIKTNAQKKLQGDQEVEGNRKKVTTVSSKNGAKSLQEFCRDLCEAASKNTIDPVFGRSKEVERVIQVLARRSKNNPILLGEPGVGKTAIAEGLAHCIVKGSSPGGYPLPDFLVGKKILQLDVGLLIAGAKERGELERRVTSMLAELQNRKDIILMIDEIHMLVGGGSVRSGGLDISNLMKPALARGQLHCIGATTLDEHRKYFEKDSALERRFQPVMVNEPTGEEALIILEGLKERYERHHQCIYDAEALPAAVALSSRYIPDRFLPDKALDVMDEAASRVRIQAYTARRAAVWGRAVAEWDHLVQVLDAKDEAVQDGHFEEALLLRAHEMEMRQKLGGPAGLAQSKIPRVRTADVEAVVSAWSGVPVEQMSSDEMKRLRQLQDSLKVFEEHMSAVSSALKRARVGLKDPNRPIAALMFCGPTGVGKTELTKVLTEQYFGSTDAMLQLDMSEYMERHSVAKLIGAPPGYVGYGDGGKLTESVRRKPFCVLLLDEIEKAHPDVFNILLQVNMLPLTVCMLDHNAFLAQVLEDGHLTDSTGRTVSFKNCLVVMTSNVGSSAIAGGGNSLGFALPGASAEDDQYKRLHSLVTDELKVRPEPRAYFRPEMLNRLDEVVVFRQLDKQSMRSIADLVLADTASQLAKQNIKLEVSPAVMAKIVEEGYDQAYGARPLRRAVANLVESALSDALLHHHVVSGDTALLECDAVGTVLVTVQRAVPFEPLRNSIVNADGLLHKLNVDLEKDIVNA
ncbi:MAG: ATP-dependent Clp protease ATP-binding subunit clpA protein [Trebouxia sp. A1-2]|nr:MAG: ATP-dependent Clp protease ATP-binding subunit clpA protein [Trebouxia sp. A1-2]